MEVHFCNFLLGIILYRRFTKPFFAQNAELRNAVSENVHLVLSKAIKATSLKKFWKNSLLSLFVPLIN